METPAKPPKLRKAKSLVLPKKQKQRKMKSCSAIEDIADVAEERQPLEGLLCKYTNVVKGWQYRWFVLEPESGKLEYFEKEDHKLVSRPRGAVHLAGAVISPSDEDSQTFIVHAANGEIYRLRALDARERQHWVNRLRATAEYHTDFIAQHAPPISREARPQTFGSQYSLQSNRQNGSTDNLYADTNTRSQPPKSPGAKVKKSTRKPPPPRPPPPVSDSFKQVREKLSHVQAQSDTLHQRIEELPTSGEHITSMDRDLLMMKATSNATLACLEQCLHILQQQQPPSNQQNIPEAAMIEWLDPKVQPGTAIGRSMNTPVSPADSFVSAASIAGPAEAINHDQEVEDEVEYSDTDLGAIEEHKSIILHLLSQLKLGMDLTKVVLPTFILEKRSLLEMFADCMAHPEYFLRIPDLPTAEARILGVLEWYLTSFHAGRKGAVAKKPYNPIIGETFHCSWQVPTADINSKTLLPDSADGGHVPLYYNAEQVSHHPPISAFYFESPEKQMYMNASIWTKSKFMGMSIGVVMVGKVCLHDLVHEEEYNFSLPSAYARSILTVPWVELGDRVTLTCAKTGYSASIIFHTKPFYGGKLHRITAEVKNPVGENVCKVAGEWNGVMEFTYANGETKTIDTNKMKTVRKRVRPLTLQGDFESRKLWQNVTKSLKDNDINKATEHKHFLEERQRQGERHRKETNTAFPTKYFHDVGSSVWVYNSPLKKGQKDASL